MAVKKEGVAAPVVQAVVLSAHFKLMFYSVIGITVFAMTVALILGVVSLLADRQTKIVETLIQDCMGIAKMGFAVLVGLVGGKVA